MRKQIRSTLCDLTKELFSDNCISKAELYDEHDVHAYLRMGNPQHTLHVQAYLGLSDASSMKVCAWLQDTDKLRRVRLGGQVSVGNEHSANLPDFSFDGQVEYNAVALKQALMGTYDTYCALEKQGASAGR